jgi:hypothetical protein
LINRGFDPGFVFDLGQRRPDWRDESPMPKGCGLRRVGRVIIEDQNQRRKEDRSRDDFEPASHIRISPVESLSLLAAGSDPGRPDLPAAIVEQHRGGFLKGRRKSWIRYLQPRAS